MDNKIKPFGIGRNWDYFKQILIIRFKELTEYKFNLYNTIFIQIFFYLTFIPFVFIFYNNFGDLIGWSLKDFILFLVIGNLIHVFYGTFLWRRNIFENSQLGELNKFLIRPLNVYFSYNFFYIHNFIPLFIFANFILFLIAVIYYKIYASIYFLYLLITIILLIIESILLCNFIDSLSFILKGYGRFLLNIVEYFYVTTRNYPAQFFAKSQLSLILYLFQGYFVSFLIIDLFRYNIFPIKYLLILICLIIFFAVGIWINWHYGLKRYEAFG